MVKKNSGGNGKGNKSDAIREHLAQFPKAKSSEIVAALAEKGIKVAPSLIYFVKSKQRQAKQRAKRDKVAASSRESGAANPVEVVLRVKDLARELGGIKNLKQLVDLLAE
jgi:hypothetical protein